MRSAPAAAAAAAAAFAFLAATSPALAASQPSWRAAGDTAAEHVDQTATLLADGTVLVVGGHDNNGRIPSGDELFDPASGRWQPARSGVPRAGQAAVRLDDGRVLVVGGGVSTGGAPYEVVASCELYDPRTGTWATAAPMSVPRYHPTLTVLPDSRVLAAGGGSGGDIVSAGAELFDPSTGRWTEAPPMSTPRLDASAVLLHTGQVLVAGGEATANEASSLSSAELFDYRTNRWTPAPSMYNAHAAAISAILPDGTALVAGGYDYAGGFGIATGASEFYDPVNGRWSAGPPLQLARGEAGFARLTDGSVLAVGGDNRQASVRTQATGELLDWRSRRWTLLPPTGRTRIRPTVTALPPGGALVVGGGSDVAAQLFVRGSAPVGTTAGLGQAITANPPLLVVTALLLLAVLAQLALRARAQPGGGT